MEEVSKIAAENLVFIDEAGAHLGMTRTHARSAIGECSVCKRSTARQSNISKRNIDYKPGKFIPPTDLAHISFASY